MRISDWSSDVCSSDLRSRHHHRDRRDHRRPSVLPAARLQGRRHLGGGRVRLRDRLPGAARHAQRDPRQGLHLMRRAATKKAEGTSEWSRRRLLGILAAAVAVAALLLGGLVYAVYLAVSGIGGEANANTGVATGETER